MSHPVAPEHLAAAFADYTEGYLLSVTPESTTRAVAVQPRYVDGLVVVGAGRSTAANVSANPAVTVLCPPTVARGFTLLMDGIATVVDGEIRIAPTSAVLHRPPYHADGPPPPAYGGAEAAC